MAEIRDAAAVAAGVAAAELDGETLARVFDGYGTAVRSGAEHTEVLHAIRKGRVPAEPPRERGVIAMLRKATGIRGRGRRLG